MRELVSKYFLIMARPKQIDDDALLESIRSTFLELGPGASTQELARRARVSEGTLFKRFATKRRMFTESLRMPELEELEWFQSIPRRVGKGSIEEHLAQIALGFHRYASQVVPCVQMISANGQLKPQDFAKLLGVEDEAPPMVFKRLIADLFRKEMALGRVRETDPEILARLFIGAVIHDVHLRMHFPETAVDDVSLAFRIARTIADLAVVRKDASPLQETSGSQA